MDIWAAGCVLGELLDSQPMFPGDDTIDQLSHISKSLGPFPQSLKEKIARSGRSIIESQSHIRLEDRYKRKASRDVIDLLRRLLALEESDRPTASEALNHPFFSELLQPDCSLKASPGMATKHFEKENENRNPNYLGGQAGLSSPVDTPKFRINLMDRHEKLKVTETSNEFGQNESLKNNQALFDLNYQRSTKTPFLSVGRSVDTNINSVKNGKFEPLASAAINQTSFSQQTLKNKSETMNYKIKQTSKKFCTAHSTNFVLRNIQELAGKAGRARFGRKNPRDPMMTTSIMFQPKNFALPLISTGFRKN